MAIYRKGEGQMDLQKSALNQSIAEHGASRKMSDEQKYNRDVESGVEGAKNAVNYKTSVKEATENPTTLGGPVSGDALTKLKAKKIADKKTADREMKRR